MDNVPAASEPLLWLLTSSLSRPKRAQEHLYGEGGEVVGSRMSQSSPYACYTPRSFSEAFPTLLAHQHTAVYAVVLTLSPGTGQNVDGSRHNNNNNSSGGGDDMISVLVSFHGSRSNTGTASSSPPLVFSCLVAAHVSSLSARWCAELQRAFNIAAALPTGVTAEVAWLEEFHVLLFPFLPEMHYVRSLDGILGSQHYCAVRGPLSWPKATNGTDTDTDTDTDEGRGGRAAEAATALGEASEEGGDEAAAGSFHRPAKLPRWDAPLVSGAEAVVRGTGRVAALLNANIPMPRALGPCEASNASHTALSDTPEDASFALVLLHAPGRSLVTATTTALPDGGATFQTIKALTTQLLVPRLNLGPVGGAWEPGQRAMGAATRTARLPPPPPDNVCGLASLGTSYAVFLRKEARGRGRVRNVVLVLDVPMQCWQRLVSLSAAQSNARSGEGRKGAERERDALAVQIAGLLNNALLQLVSENVDLFAFRDNAASTGAGATTEEVAGEAADGPTQTTQQHSLAARTGAVYSDDLLIRSIAESVVGIIGASRNADFVRAAEDILFPSAAAISSSVPSSQPGGACPSDLERQLPLPRARPRPSHATETDPPVHARFSPAEMRWAIEGHLHRLRSSHQQRSC